jgi:hypothetical protein
MSINFNPRIIIETPRKTSRFRVISDFVLRNTKFRSIHIENRGVIPYGEEEFAADVVKMKYHCMRQTI